MLLRAFLIAGFAFALAGCGEEEKRDCCAIEPHAKCENDLLGNGVTHAEMGLLLGDSDAICPSATLSESRIRELAPIWAASGWCMTMRGPDRLRALDGGLCPVRSSADAPPLPAGVDQQVAATCAAGLVARGVTEPELWLVIGEPAAVCPNKGVTEQRLRKIIADDWGVASCTQFTKEQMLHALDSGACGGNAG